MGTESERPVVSDCVPSSRSGKKRRKIKQRELTDLEKRASSLTKFPLQIVLKAQGAFFRRVEMTQPHTEEIDVLHDDRYWSTKAGTVHERIFLATWLYLFFEGDEVIQQGLKQLIHRLADRYFWSDLPIIQQTRKNSSKPSFCETN